MVQITRAELLENLFHLWKTRHLCFTDKWSNTGNYAKCVNASSGCYWTNHSADTIADIANGQRITEADLCAFPAYTYYKNNTETLSIVDKRQRLIEQANEQQFIVRFRGKDYKGHLAGSRLDFPHVTADGGAIHYEVSWALVERIATKAINIVHV